MNAILSIVVCIVAGLGLLAFIWLCRFYDHLAWKRERNRLIRSGRAIRWEEALERVSSQEGCFVLPTSGKKGDLYYLEVAVPRDTLELLNGYEERGQVVTACPKAVGMAELKALGVGKRSLELNLQSFFD